MHAYPGCHCKAVWIISLVACVLGIKQPALNGEFSFKNWDLKGSIKLNNFMSCFNLTQIMSTQQESLASFKLLL